MSKLLMISGDRGLAAGRRGAFYNTLEEFCKYWDRIDVITPAPNVQHPVVSLFENVFIYPSPWPVIGQSFWIWKKGQEIYREHKFDLMTVNEYPPFYNGIGARMLWRKIKVPYILEIHHISGYPRSASWKETIYRHLAKMFIKYDAAKALAVRVVNQKQVPDFLEKADVPSGKIKFIPSIYLDLEIFRPQFPGKKYDLIFIGRLVGNKGVNLFLETVKKTELRALIVGEGLLGLDLKLKVKSLKLEDKVTFHGWAKDAQEVARLLNESKILVMPSYNEGGPRVVLEALACGVPVLATPVGMVPDLIKSSESGEIIDWDTDDMAKKALDLLNNQDKYYQYSQAGLKIAKNFEKKAMIKNYADQLKELL